MEELSAYVLSTLRDGELTLFRGCGAGLAPILLVAPTGEYPALDSVQHLEHEYALRADLDASWAAPPVDLIRREGRRMLVLEDPGGEPLERLLGRPLEVAQFLRIAVPLAAAIGQMHARGLIHKDLKPANILADIERGGVWLTGFGIASRLPREHQAVAPPEVIAGTLAYMAPEQTGRMNLSVDSRSDLYSLGVTFYEMLTGTLPFSAADPMEWIHCHIARQPVPPSERVTTAPAQLSAIVMKLLAKTAEERYQTAAGVEADLRKCVAAWESNGQIDPFPLGAQDASGRLLIPERLYGREREIDTLLTAFDRVVAQGRPEFVLVSGYSGVGKSSVVNELHKALVPPRGLFASGKFDQYKRDIPHATLAQALQTLVRQILVKSEAEVDSWRCALKEAVEPNGQLIVNLIPELELIIGKQPAVAELPPQDGQRRFQAVLRRFIGAFARKEHPLALFLDDLQWLDAATLDFLEHLVAHSEVRRLLLIGAYRDNEVGPAHPLRQMLEAIRNAGMPVREIALAPLALDDVGQLVADALHCKPQRARPVAQLVHEKTGGNPLFAIQFLTALAEEGLLAFDPDARVWRWDIARIRAKSYTDNVVDLMVGKLMRLSPATQHALKQLACLGIVAEVAVLALIHGETEEAMREALWEAVRAGLVVHQENTCRFLHDRIQQAAYSLIAGEHRPEAHTRVGRILLKSMTADQLAEHLFDVANQFNRGAGTLLDQDERVQVARINLRAGLRAKASAAFASARSYFSAGMALLDDRDWGSQHQLMFHLRLERAECEFLTGDFETTEQLIAELLQRGASKVDQAVVCRLNVEFRLAKSENRQAVDSALACLRLFEIKIPANPTEAEVDAEYEALWQTLDERPIESLIDLPMMTDSEMQAAMRVVSVLLPAAYHTDFHLWCLLACHMVRVSMRHGTSGAGAEACGWLGMILGPVFHRYREGYRFAKLAGILVDTHGFLANQAKTRFVIGLTAFWTQPIATTIDSFRAAFRTANEIGDLTFACYSMDHFVTSSLQRNDPLDAVWRESEVGLNFVRQARFHDVAAVIVSQQRFIATMQGRTATLSTFNDAQFDEKAFEEHVTRDRTPTMACLYWILKLQARFLSGDYAEALASADKAKALLWAASVHIQRLDYIYYTALTVAALFEKGSADKQTAWRGLLIAHGKQLREWADNYPPTFGHKHALVAAEIARLEGRDADAIRLYEQAIQSAREHGFVQNEALAHEAAARFYAARGVERFAHLCLQDARRCYLQWGALGKVKQLDDRHPRLQEERAPASPTTMIGAPVEQLDVKTVVEASQAVSGEIVLETVVKTLMVIAVKHAGAERGLLILPRGDQLWVEAEAASGLQAVEVNLRRALVTSSDLPNSVLQYVIRTHEPVVLDDACREGLFTGDTYIIEKRARSILCLPLIRQTKLVGVLYVENNLAASAFTPARIAVLKVLSSQAAISLDNARLYGELMVSEERWRNLFESVPVGVTLIGSDRRYIAVNPAFQKMTGYSEAELRRLSPTDITHEDDQAATEAVVAAGSAGEPYGQRIRKRYRRRDGGVIWAEVDAFLAPVAGGAPFLAAVAVDITQRLRAEEALRDAHADVERMARLTTMGQLVASIAHEINQPLGGVVTNGEAGLRWLNRDKPDLDEVRDAFVRIVRDGRRAGEVIRGIRALAKKSTPQLTQLDINDAIREVLALTRDELLRRDVVLRTELAGDRPITGDRVQLQQVLLNLIMNSIEAMRGITDRTRELTVSSLLVKPSSVLVAVEDTGPGLDPAIAQRVFEPFFTTKSDGLGMGLAICRSIIEAHGGRLWMSPRAPHGAGVRFTVPFRVEQCSSSARVPK
jgi:PAS domain S-box-containing protein